jgi:hypothetical protein
MAVRLKDRKRFVNDSQKINLILSCFDGDDERDGLDGGQIAKRLRRLGYDVDEGSLKMFMYYHMVYQYLRKEKVRGVSVYYPI